MKAKNVNTLSAVWAVVICVVMGLTACQDYSIDSQPEGAPQIHCDAVEQYNVQSVNVDNIIFNVSANTPWKITVTTDDEDKSWCVPSPGISSAAGLVAEIAVSIADNKKDTPREAILTITGDDVDKSIVVKVVQESKSALQVAGAAVEDVFKVTGEMKEMTIRANRAWEIVYKNEQDRSWLHFDSMAGEVNGVETKTINVTVDPNESVKREAKIIVKTEFDEVEKTIMQGGATLEVVEEELAKLTALPANSTTTIEVPVSATINWEIEEGADAWITNLAKADDKLTFSCEPNYNFASRTGVISLKAVGSSMTYSVPVTQLGATFNCWGKSDKVEIEMPQGRITDKGILLNAKDNFRIAFPGAYKHAKLTWVFEELSISSPLVIVGANDYGGAVPNTHIVMCNGGSGSTVNNGNDWRINGLGWYIVKSDILKNNSSQIKTIELLFAIDGSVKLSVKDKGDNVLFDQTATVKISEAQWGAKTFSYSLYFQATATDDAQYCILKSFKAESLD